MSKIKTYEGSVTKYSYTSKSKDGTRTRKNTKWRYQLWLPVDPDRPNGKHKLAGKSGFTTKQDALDALAEAKKQLDAGLRHGAGKTTLSTYAWGWVESKRLAPSTLAGYEKIIRNHIDPVLGGEKLQDITVTTLNKHYRKLLENGMRNKQGELVGKGLSANTVNKVHTVISAILESAVSDGYIPQNPARKSNINAPKTKEINAGKDEVNPWTATELKEFLAWDKDTYDDPLYTLWYFYAMTGVRRSEALALRWGDFDPTNMKLAVRRAVDPATPKAVKSTKSGQARVLDLSAADIQVLKDWKKLRASISFDFVKPDAYIFGNDTGGVRSPNEVGRRWRYRLERAIKEGVDVRQIRLHDLRHTHATLLFQAGVQPKVVQERLGHSTIAITMNIYSHVLPSMQRAAVDSLTALMA